MTQETAILLCVIAIPLIWLAFYSTRCLYFVKRIYNREIDDDHLFDNEQHLPDCLCGKCVTTKEIYGYYPKVDGQRINDASKYNWVIRDIHRQVYLASSPDTDMDKYQWSYDFFKAYRYTIYQTCESYIELIKMNDLERSNNHGTPYNERFFEIIKVY